MAFSPSKLYALFLILMIFVSTAPPILAGPPCSKEHPKKGHKKEPKAPPVVVKPPPVIVKPPPVIVKPPPVIVKPSPPIVVTPPVVTPPVTTPPVYTPPVVTPPSIPCPPPPPPPPATCPIDSLKLGACVDLLGGLVHIGVGDPVVNHCCPILGGLVELEAAVCLCTTIKLKLLNLNIILPLALKLLVTCGKTPPPGFTCPN